MAMGDGLTDLLWNKDVFDKYDDKGKYKDHVLEQYKLYVEMADRISHRRQIANTFFLSVNTGLVTLSGVLLNFAGMSCKSVWLLLISIAGIILSYAWYRLIRSYKDLNSAKFAVIHEIESTLPIQPYAAEWKKLGEGKNKKLYLPFTHIETKVPWVFALLYFVMMMVAFIAQMMVVLRYVYLLCVMSL